MFVWYYSWSRHSLTFYNPAHSGLKNCHIMLIISRLNRKNVWNDLQKPTSFDISALFLCLPLCFLSCGAALVAGMPLCAVPVHSGRWGARGGDRVQETKRRWPTPNRRYEPLLERDQTEVPQHSVRGYSHFLLRLRHKPVAVRRGGCFQKHYMCFFEMKEFSDKTGV